MLLTAVALTFSVSAMASKARVSSLQGADHIIDNQTVFLNPADLNYLGQYITYEFGAAGTAAEGGFARKLSNGDRLSIYLGHKNTIPDFVNGDVRTGNSFSGQNNPVEVLYGTGHMGFGGSLSTIDDKKNGVKENTVIGKFGIRDGNYAFYVHAHLLSTAEKTTASVTDKMTAAPQIVLGGSYDVDTLHYFGALHWGQAKNDIGASSTSKDIKDTDVSLGLEDRSMKTADNDIYYGAKIDYVQRDVAGAKITGTQLPVFLGMEYPVTSWATFRGSVVQNLLLGSIKDETATNKDAAGISNNTTVAAGLGLQYKNLVLDGSLTAATNGQVNGNAFLTNASVTYNF
jgi:hypothetical protein